jgi:futalosine hydrolase
MKILIVVATFSEIQPFLKSLGLNSIPETGIKTEQHHIHIIITGVGMVATAYATGKEFATNNYDLALNLGVAGSFSRRLEIGEVMQITTDVFSELGAEDDEEFISLDELELGETLFNGSDDPKFHTSLKKATAITVNKVHGNEDTIAEVKEMFNPKIESMEGAAFFYACEEANIPGIQVRAISNYVEKRNRESWNIPLAVKNLNAWLIQYLKEI